MQTKGDSGKSVIKILLKYQGIQTGTGPDPLFCERVKIHGKEVFFMAYVSEDYIKAYKAGKRDYQARMMRGEIPTLKVLDDVLPSRGRYSEVPLGWYRFRSSRSWEQRQVAEAVLFPETSCRSFVKIRSLPTNGVC